MGDIPLAKTPDIYYDHPEEDRSAPLNPLGIHHYQMTVGCINWVATLGGIEMACATSSLARFYAGPREENLARALRIVGYFKK